MSNPSVSRRDWFRLRLSNNDRQTNSESSHESTQSHSTAHPTVGSHSQTVPLTQMPLPPNHDGMDLAQLPPMSEAVLDIHQLDLLIDDIGQLTTDVTLMLRQPGDAASQQNKSIASGELDLAGQLDVARHGLKTGLLQRLQVRYTWENARWIDTLEAKANGFRLVRIRHTN